MQELEQTKLQNLEQVIFGVSLIHFQSANWRLNLWPQNIDRYNLIISLRKEISFTAYSSFPAQYFLWEKKFIIFRSTAVRNYNPFSHESKSKSKKARW